MATKTFTYLDPDPRNLGILARFVSKFEPFSKYEFGEMMKALFHQIDRKTHLALIQDREVVGYLGWTRTTNQNAEQWSQGMGGLQWLDRGQAVAVTILCVDDPKDMLRMIKQGKLVEPNRDVYWKRHYIEADKTPHKSVVKRGGAPS